jgi:hypothetical protein
MDQKMNQKSLRQRAESLLEVHNGACSVWMGSHLLEAFQQMEKEGLVTIKPSGGIFWIVDVRMERQGV